MSSTVYTMGTALTRAFAGKVPVSLLIEGHWMGGEVVAMDSYGVVLDFEGTEHLVVKLDRVSAVRVMSSMPTTAAAHPTVVGL